MKLCGATCFLEDRTWRLVWIPLGTQIVTLLISAESALQNDRYLFISDTMNSYQFEPWGIFAARWYLWMLTGASISSFKISHFPNDLKWLGWWNLVLIYGAMLTRYKQNIEEDDGHRLDVVESIHLAIGVIFLITCWVETCTVWYPNTRFTWIFGVSVLTYLFLYALTRIVSLMGTQIVSDHPASVAQHAIVIVTYVTQCVMAPVMGTSEWAPRIWCFSCLCPQRRSAGCDDDHGGAEEP